MRFSKNLEANLEHLKQTLSLEKNFDVVYRVVSIGGKKGCLLFVDGLTKDEVLLKILQAWWSIKPEDLPGGRPRVFRKIYALRGGGADRE